MLSISSGVMPGKTKKADEKRLLSTSVRGMIYATVYKLKAYLFSLLVEPTGILYLNAGGLTTDLQILYQ